MTPDPSAGDLIHRVTWQQDSTTLDAMNEPTGSPTVMGTYWALVQPLTGMELVNARQLKATTSGKVTMRNVGPIKSSDSFLFQGRMLGIDAVYRKDERNAFLILHFSELIAPQ